MKIKGFAQIALTIAALLGSLTASAWDFKLENEDGQTIYYGILDELDPLVYVSSKLGYHYTGDIVVPSKVTWEDVEYTVIMVGSYAFQGCEDLITVTLPETIEEIGEEAFQGCTSLQEVKIPASVKKIGEAAFGDCTSMSTLNLPEGIENIRPGAFIRCTSLKEVTIPESLKEIYGSTFGACTSMEAFYGKFASEDHKMLISQSHSLIAFAPYGIKDFTLPEDIDFINSCCFLDCTELESITIGPLVFGINYSAFENCPNLQVIKISAPTPPECHSYVFHKVRTKTCKLYVPKESVDLYASTEPWSDFENILPLEEAGVEMVEAEDASVWYDLSGRVVDEGADNGVLLHRTASGVEKVLKR